MNLHKLIVTAFVRGGSLALNLLINIILTRTLTVSNFGEFNFFLGVFLFLSQLCVLGYGNWIIKNATCDNKPFSYLVVAIKSVSINYCIISLLFGYLIINYMDSRDATFNSYWVLFFIVVAFRELLLPYFQSIGNTNIGLFFSNISQLIFHALLITLGYDVYFSYIASNILSIMLSMLYIYSTKPKFDNKVIARGFFEITRDSFGFIKAQATTIIVSSSPVLVSGYLLSSNDLGIFSAVYKVTSMIGVILTIVGLYAAPDFAKKFSDNEYKLRDTALKYSKLCTLLAVPIALFFFTFSGDILKVFGDSYSLEGNDIFKYLSLAFAYSVLTGSVGYLLLMSGNERCIFQSNLLALTPYMVLVLSQILFDAKTTPFEIALSVVTSIILKNTYNLIQVRLKLGFWNVRLL